MRYAAWPVAPAALDLSDSSGAGSFQSGAANSDPGRGRALDLAAFLFGVGAVTQTRVVGALALTELACAVLAPFLLVRGWRRLRQTRAPSLLVMGLLWLGSALLTDYVRESSSTDTVKGAFAILLLLATFVVAFALLAPDLRRVRWMALGFALSAVTSIFFFRSQALLGGAAVSGVGPEELMSFKTVFAYVWLWVLLAFVVFADARWPRTTALVVLGSAFYFLLGGARNLFLVAGLAGAAMLVSHSLPNLARWVRRNQLAGVLAAVVGLWTASSLYGAVAERGWMGEAEKAKYEAQSRSELGLLRGRAEFVGSLAAIDDSPLLGHGSWARDRKGYALRVAEASGHGGEDFRRRALAIAAGTALIPCHSHLWQAWVWHGLAGGLFWLLVASLIVAYLRRALAALRPIRGYSLLLLLAAGWDLLFSPLSQRPRWAVVLCICLLGLAYARRRSSPHGSEEVELSDWDGTWSLEAET